jgi:molecular chaperone GrpE
MAKKSREPDQTDAQSTEAQVETESEQTSATSGATGPADQSPQSASQPSEPTSPDRVAALTADLQRLQAEFQNYRRRAEADRSDLMSLATARVVREFLAVRDSFDAEAAHRPTTADPEWAKSIDAIRTQFDQILSSLGVARFESFGQPFDPRRHEAVASDGDGTTVTAELQAGYELAGRILRPAIVKVGPAPVQ